MLSIIIPTLNEEKYLPFLLRAIQIQNFNDYELIVADAGSQDKTIEIAKSYDCKIVSGGLPAKGRNEGAKIAQGDLLLFIDADVVLPKQSLTDFIEEFQKRNLDVAGFLLQPLKENKFVKILCNLFYNQPILMMEKFLPHAAMAILIKKNLHQKINGFDEEVKLAEDHDYVRRATKFGKFGILKSTKIFFSPRRFENDGWARTYLKYLFCEFYMVFRGPAKSDIFKYKFNHYKNKTEQHK